MRRPENRPPFFSPRRGTGENLSGGAVCNETRVRARLQLRRIKKLRYARDRISEFVGTPERRCPDTDLFLNSERWCEPQALKRIVGARRVLLAEEVNFF
jgi:hypothetical protein